MILSVKPFRVDRREFLRNASLAGLSGLLLPRNLLAIPAAAFSRVVIVDDTGATTGGSINASVVQAMVQGGICSLGQQDDIGEAWKQLLPGVTVGSRIGIKVNCINSSMSTHPAVAHAVATALKQMSFSGIPFPENNIIIFDRTSGELRNAGYSLNTTASGVRCFGTDSSGVGYSSETHSVAGRSQRLSKILTERIDYLINLAVLKNHGGAGVTLCLKNHYGTCDSPGSLHDASCDPYAAAINATEPVRTKQMVNIIDALFGIRSGGPGGPPQFVANTLLMSADVVAVDTCGRQLLADNACTTVSHATHIDTAAVTYGLGTNNPSLMDVARLHNPSTTSVDPSPIPARTLLHQNFPNPFNPATTIRFAIAEASPVRLRVVDAAGRIVTTLLDDLVAAGEHTVVFDGSRCASGPYLCELTANGGTFIIKMTLVK